jgi:hypothetical protein
MSVQEGEVNEIMIQTVIYTKKRTKNSFPVPIGCLTKKLFIVGT